MFIKCSQNSQRCCIHTKSKVQVKVFQFARYRLAVVLMMVVVITGDMLLGSYVDSRASCHGDTITSDTVVKIS